MHANLQQGRQYSMNTSSLKETPKAKKQSIHGHNLPISSCKNTSKQQQMKKYLKNIDYLNSKQKSTHNSKSSKSKKSDDSQPRHKEYLKNPEHIQYYKREKNSAEKKNQRNFIQGKKTKSKVQVVSSKCLSFRSPNYLIRQSKCKKKSKSQSKIGNKQFKELSPKREKERNSDTKKSSRPSMILVNGGRSHFQKVIKSESNIFTVTPSKIAVESKIKRVKIKSKTKIKKKKEKSTSTSQKFIRPEKKSYAKAFSKTGESNSKVRKILSKQPPEAKQNEPQKSNLKNQIQTIKEQLSLNQVLEYLSEEFYSMKKSETQAVSAEIIKQRFRNLSMLGKICGSMALHKNNFLLAIAYLDRFIHPKTNIAEIKAASLASLIISLKVEHAEMFGTLEYQFAQNCEEEVNTNCTTNLKEKTQFRVHKQKMPNILNLVLSQEEIFSEYDQIIGIDDVNEMQMQIMAKVNFKLQVKSISFWISTFGYIWENFITEFSFANFSVQAESLKKLVKAKFAKNGKLYHFLCSLSEVCEIMMVGFPKPLVVLSIMYLLIRIYVSYPNTQWEKGFEFYRMKLTKSANVIFIDKVGLNQIFGDFLGLFNLDLGGIVNCCQKISKYLNFRMLQSMQGGDTFKYCPQRFRFLFARLLE